MDTKINRKTKIKYLKKNYGRNILPLSIFENADYIGNKPTEIFGFYRKEISILEAKKSLLKTIEHYNLFSSRLIMIDDDKYALQYCEDGFQWNVLPTLDVAMGDINIDDVSDMIVHVKTLPGEPLFAVTIIPIKDGILCGISCSHAIGDATSLMLFMFAWERILTGNAFPLPSTQRLFTGEPVLFNKIEKEFIPPLSELSDTIQNRVKNLREEKLYNKREYFSDELLDALKDKAKSENKKYIVSNNQIISSFLLKKYHDDVMPDTDKIRIRIPINLRYIHPDIDSSYIGNAVFSSVIEFTKNEINTMSVYQLAYRLKESITAMRNADYVKSISYLSRFGIEYKGDIFKTLPPYNRDTDILSANLTHVRDLESLGFGSKVATIIYVSSTMQTAFIMLREKKDRLFAEIKSRYPLS